MRLHDTAQVNDLVETYLLYCIKDKFRNDKADWMLFDKIFVALVVLTMFIVRGVLLDTLRI